MTRPVDFILLGLALGLVLGYPLGSLVRRAWGALLAAWIRAADARSREEEFQRRIHVGGHHLHSERDHAEDEDPYAVEICQACVLSYCKVCHGAEASLPTECPGRRMSEDEQAWVQSRDLDYYDGKWQLPKARRET